MGRLTEERERELRNASWFYSYDPEDGFDSRLTADDARRAAEASLESCQDRAGDGWPEGADAIEWGRLIPMSAIVETENIRADSEADEESRAYEAHRKGWYAFVQYELTPVVDDVGDMLGEIDALRAQVAERDKELARVRASRCPVHDYERHGKEAEELRAGIERLIRDRRSVSSAKLQDLLDGVDARDSLAFGDRSDELATLRADAERLQAFRGHVGHEDVLRLLLRHEADLRQPPEMLAPAADAVADACVLAILALNGAT